LEQANDIQYKASSKLLNLIRSDPASPLRSE
jgi:hypothetical protein